ncbi:hypothetical protein R3P38DRAFT_3466276 [Favolaschia claudopus]|uniref:Uncharacterized protein n=1 Tax=Favolaschia claudopus TaxID=2862362 RepID=A0AAV9ZEJ3_9AGAR
MKKAPAAFTKRLSTLSFTSRRSTSPTPTNASNQEAAGAENSDPTPLAPETTWQCSKCEKPVKVGLAGQYNYDEHQKSEKCKKAEAALKKKRSEAKGASLFRNFFKNLLQKLPQPFLRRLFFGRVRVLLARTSAILLVPPSLASSPNTMYEPTSRITSPPDSPSKPERTHSVCPGIQLVFRPGENQHTSYPFGMHAQISVPWDYFSEGNCFFIRSTSCRKQVHGSESHLCRPCDMLNRRSELLHDVRQRIADGIHENTPLIFYPIGGLIRRIRKKNDQLEVMRLTKMNDNRVLAGKIAQLDLHKQFMMAVATNNVPRISGLVRAGINNGESIQSMLERFYRACVDVHREGPKYNPKAFMPDDHMVGLCVLRLGGARLAEILHRALGLPGLTTLRKHSVIRPLRASPAMPTITEIEANMDAYTTGEQEPSGSSRMVHRVLMLDEIALEKRPRWDHKTNKILGACREHSHAVSLDFCDLDDAVAFFASLDAKKVHLASEATVAAVGSLARNPQMYNPRPVCISETETGEQHAHFLRRLLEATDNRKTHGNITYRTTCVASDGEAKRGLALALEFMKYRLAVTSPIYPLLQPLEFMNLLVGADDITPDKDYRHIVPAIVKQHLHDIGLSAERLHSLLNPNDRQDVDLTYGLLKEIWTLPNALPNAAPTYARARAALQLFGRLAYHLVMPYIYLNLSLREQLTHLSTAAHLLLALFTMEEAGTEFMANQTFVNIMLMIKNAFFCVAKVKIDISDEEFFLILLGTDRLEKLYGLIRTAVGTDSNFDILQLAGRASNLTEVSVILALKPEWDRGPRRLKLPAVINERGDVSSKADHISPASWIGDVHVAGVVLHSCWINGRLKAEQLIPGASEHFEKCAQIAKFDILSPFGELLVGKPDAESAFEIDPELLAQGTTELVDGDSTVDPAPSGSLSHSAEVLEDDVEDFEDVLSMHDTENAKHSPHVCVDGKQISKASILKDLMQNRSHRLSTDRTKRVAGIAAFSNNSGPLHDQITFDNTSGAPSLRIGNPIATLVLCEGEIFLAIGQVNTIVLGTRPMDSILLDLLPDRGTKISYQIFQLVSTDSTDDPSAQHDWKWSLRFESKSIHDVAGRLIYPLNPTVSNRVPGKPTYMFSSHVLVTMAANINIQITSSTPLPDVGRSDTFPYRHEGKACFHVLPETGLGNGRGELGFDFLDKPLECTKCWPTVSISRKNYQRILEHNGAHILFDELLAKTVEPCGLCLRPFPMCEFVFQKTTGTTSARQIDWTRSTCLNPLKFQMAAAMKSSEKSPCTNHLIQCPLQCGIVVWTYNLEAHYRSYHQLQTTANIGTVYQTGASERQWMKKIWDNRQNQPTTRKMKNKKTKTPLVISEAHRSTMAFRNFPEEDPSDPEDADIEGESVPDASGAPSTRRRAARRIVSDSDSDSRHSSAESVNVSKIKEEIGVGATDLVGIWDDEHYELEYVDEHSGYAGARLLPLEDDDVDMAITHLAAPTLENSGAELNSITPTSPSNSIQAALPVASHVVPALQASVTVNPGPGTNTTAAEELPKLRVRAKRNLTDNLECICGHQVTEEQRVSSAVKCGRSGCETVWFHEGCADSGGKKSWIVVARIKLHRRGFVDSNARKVNSIDIAEFLMGGDRHRAKADEGPGARGLTHSS